LEKIVFEKLKNKKKVFLSKKIKKVPNILIGKNSFEKFKKKNFV